MKYRVLAITALVVLVLDQLVKWWIVSTLKLGDTISIIDGFARLRYVQNTGAAFGFLRDATGLLSILSPLVIAGILVAFVRMGNPSRLTTVAAGLIVGGALGNLVDRIRLGYVVDFIEVYGPHLNINNTVYTFPVFNVGDSGITIGVILVLASLIFAKDENKAPQAQPTADDQPTTPPNTSTSNNTHVAG